MRIYIQDTKHIHISTYMNIKTSLQKAFLKYIIQIQMLHLLRVKAPPGIFAISPSFMCNIHIIITLKTLKSPIDQIIIYNGF